ncbi:MAG: hypothetical protein VB142_06370 [Burkholderia sp.]
MLVGIDFGKTDFEASLEEFSLFASSAEASQAQSRVKAMLIKCLRS